MFHEYFSYFTNIFTNKLDSDHYIQVDKIFGAAKKWSLVTLDKWSIYVVYILPNITWADL